MKRRIPIGRATARIPPKLLGLARRGVLTLGLPNDPSLYPRMPRALKRGTSKQLLDAERGSR
jgi:hypothetical protein